LEKILKKRKIIGTILIMLLLSIGTIGYVNDASRYKVKGVDVSHFQGEVNWYELKKEDVEFTFIKATEGSTYVDECFKNNIKGAFDAGFYTGAYHFFRFESDGMKQARNFCNHVELKKGMLPPVVDVEYYAKYSENPPKKELVKIELKKMLKELERYYAVKPIIYTTLPVYYKYLKSDFTEYPLWIRNVYFSPDIDMSSRWMFWQYTDKAVLSGYAGTEKYIDMNVFKGTIQELDEICIK